MKVAHLYATFAPFEAVSERFYYGGLKMVQENIIPYTLETELTSYMPLPRKALALDLPPSALLQYAALLDRGTLSRKNHFADENGQIYVYFPVEELAAVLGISGKVVQRNQKRLEQAGLIQRKHISHDRSVRTYLYLFEENKASCDTGTKGCIAGDESSRPTPRKLPANNIRKQQELNNNYYQHKEGESL